MVKGKGQEKSNLKTPREFSAGGVVYRKKDQVEWLVTKSSPSTLYPQAVWRLPKGRLDDDGDLPGPLARGEEKASEDQIQVAALKEVEEEGGVEAKIVKKIRTIRYFFKSEGKTGLKFVTFYLMEWVKDLPQGFCFETSEVKWLGLSEAEKTLSYDGEKKVLEEAGKILEAGIQESLV